MTESPQSALPPRVPEAVVSTRSSDKLPEKRSARFHVALINAYIWQAPIENSRMFPYVRNILCPHTEAAPFQILEGAAYVRSGSSWSCISNDLIRERRLSSRRVPLRCLQEQLSLNFRYAECSLADRRRRRAGIQTTEYLERATVELRHHMRTLACATICLGTLIAGNTEARFRGLVNHVGHDMQHIRRITVRTTNSKTSVALRHRRIKKKKNIRIILISPARHTNQIIDYRSPYLASNEA